MYTVDPGNADSVLALLALKMRILEIRKGRAPAIISRRPLR
ncbi:hypothetical protein ABN028_05950 [Actinopolymorpha sp. B17G11]